MGRTSLRGSALSLAALALAATTMSTTPAAAQSKEDLAKIAAEIPEPAREFRAAWVSTVANIDWPSKRNISTQQQQEEAITILDKAKELNLNALVFQVRPSGDAFYRSDLEPWSEFLTGEQGKAPEPFYDPLEFWVTEAHKRGIELHTWFNPYRAKHPNQKSPLTPDNFAVKNPEAVVTLEQGFVWMIPTNEKVQKLSLDVVLDVVRRYDIDGVHFDDYFYPYDSYNGGKDFPDSKDYEAYQKAGGKLSLGDWRRDAVNKFVLSIHEGVREEKSWVKFGMSPFGIWRPGHPASIQGLDQYDKLYADAKLWLNKGWVDYYTPQLYWPSHQMPQSFPVLLGWWKDQTPKNVHLWPGLGSYRAGEERWGTHREVLTQVLITRAMVPEAPGQVHFTFNTFLNDKDGVATALKQSVYAQPALVPASPWLDNRAPKAPTVQINQSASGVRQISWTPQGKEEAFVYVVYRKEGSAWKYDIVPAGTTTYAIPDPKAETVTTDDIQGGTKTETKKAADVSYVAVSAVDRTGNESKRTVVAVK